MRPQNIGPANRVIRLVAGLIVLLVSYLNLYSSPVWFAGIIVGLFLVFESLSGWCVWHGLRGSEDKR